MDKVRVIPIPSPSGVLSRPKLITRKVDGKIITEAHWYDPRSGAFFKKGLVSIIDEKTGQEVSE